MRSFLCLLCMTMAAPALAQSPALKAQGVDAFAGEWHSPKDTSSIVEARVYSQGGRWMVQLQGRCTPRPCVWDPLPLVAAPSSGPPQATATFSRSNMRRLITLHLGEDAIVVIVDSHQLSVPARGIGERRYTSTDELGFVKLKTEPLPTTRPAR